MIQRRTRSDGSVLRWSAKKQEKKKKEERMNRKLTGKKMEGKGMKVRQKEREKKATLK